MMQMLNSTIFDCLIYKGYGQRVSERDHLPYPDAHFALELVREDQRRSRPALAQLDLWLSTIGRFGILTHLLHVAVRGVLRV